MKVAACGKWFDYLNMMPLQEGLILERLVEEYSDTDEYSCAVTPQVRQTGNRLSGLAGTAYASLLT